MPYWENDNTVWVGVSDEDGSSTTIAGPDEYDKDRFVIEMLDEDWEEWLVYSFNDEEMKELHGVIGKWLNRNKLEK